MHADWFKIAFLLDNSVDCELEISYCVIVDKGNTDRN